MDVVLDSDVLSQLNTEKAKALHELSVGLGACGVDKLVNLPQIIVVGDQSSGKSSVLEAISHVRFPVKGGLCTRFATELVLRQGNETRVNVSVKFADKSKPIQSFKRTGFHESDLPDIINEAKESMGFTRAGLEFSKDVLRLEIEGPKMYPLSLVDLPGLFRNVTETQSLGGKEIVDGLVESYMGQKNSIILVVITADNQLASHEALRRVKAVDPDGRRTIGVITKPDRAELSNEQTYVKVAKNQETANKLHLGWHVLRNRTENETSLDKRDEIEEAFFKTTAWASIPPEDRGITSLRKKLSEVLYTHIRNSLPSVIEDIEQKLKVREEERNRLGDARASEVEYRSFLLRIAGEFQRLARDGIYGRYDDVFFGGMEGEVHKLRALLRNFNRAFDHALRTRGSTQVILENEDDEIEDDDIPGYLEEFLERYPYDFPDPEIITRGELNAQLQKQAAANQGLEFPGYANRDLAVQLFKKQAAPWERIAKFHVDRVTTATKAFVDALFTHIVGLPDTNQTTEAILSTCVDHFFDKKAKLLKQKLEELLQAYSQGYALPVDIEFYHSLSQKSSSRLASQINKIMRDEYPEMFEGDNRKKLSEKMITTALASNEELHDGEFGTEKLIDSMLAYYEMSRRTFTDNVINLAIENCLVYDIPNILTPTSINRMSEERLKELAAESDHTVSRRKALNEEIDILSNGLARCQAYRPRKATVLPSSTKGKALLAAKQGGSTKTSTPMIASAGKTPSPSLSASPDTRTYTIGKTKDVPVGTGNATKGVTAAKPLVASDANPVPKTGGLFGAPTTSTSNASPAPKTGGLFGAPPTSTSSSQPSTSVVGTGGLFGAPTTSASTSQPSTAALGSKPPVASDASPMLKTGGIFGAPTTSTSSAGLAPKTGGIFGPPTTSASNASPAPKTGGIFGPPTTSTSNASPAPKTGGIFGPPTTSTSSSQPSNLLFGSKPPATSNASPVPKTGGLYGAPPNSTPNVSQGGSNIFVPKTSSTGATGFGAALATIAANARSSTSGSATTTPSDSPKPDPKTSQAFPAGGLFGEGASVWGAKLSSPTPTTQTVTGSSLFSSAPQNYLQHQQNMRGMIIPVFVDQRTTSGTERFWHICAPRNGTDKEVSPEEDRIGYYLGRGT